MNFKKKIWGDKKQESLNSKKDSKKPLRKKLVSWADPEKGNKNES